MNCCIIFPEDNTMANGKWGNGLWGGDSAQITNVARRWQVHGWKDGRCHEHNKWPQLTDMAFSLFILADSVKITPLSNRKLLALLGSKESEAKKTHQVTKKKKPPRKVGVRENRAHPPPGSAVLVTCFPFPRAIYLVTRRVATNLHRGKKIP